MTKKKGISLKFADNGNAEIDRGAARKHLCHEIDCQFKDWSDSEEYLCTAKTSTEPVSVWDYWKHPDGCPKGYWFKYVSRSLDEQEDSGSSQ